MKTYVQKVHFTFHDFNTSIGLQIISIKYNSTIYTFPIHGNKIYPFADNGHWTFWTMH